MKEKIIIRKMQNSDIEEVLKIYKQGVLSGKCTFETKIPTILNFDKSHLSVCRYVAENSGKVVGYAVLSPTSKRHCYRGVTELSIYLDNNYHNMGIGTKLIKTLQNDIINEDIWLIRSCIFCENSASIALHEKCDFKYIGKSENVGKDENGKWRDVVWYEYHKPLN